MNITVGVHQNRALIFYIFFLTFRSNLHGKGRALIFLKIITPKQKTCQLLSEPINLRIRKLVPLHMWYFLINSLIFCISQMKKPEVKKNYSYSLTHLRKHLKNNNKS
ncbi:hypothetical protein V8G54_013770 [Vigna mungo]|uniref:Uncharacterized protein n=1 Tax=Vigna mungo TaxID=3915 RepID=A0AAQ3NFD5_VIGMU